MGENFERTFSDIKVFQAQKLQKLLSQIGRVYRFIEEEVQMPAATIARSIECRLRESGFGNCLDQSMQVSFIVVFAVIVDVKNSKASGFSKARTKIEFLVSARGGLENFGISQAPVFLLGCKPSVGTKPFINVAVAMQKKPKELSNPLLKLREVLIAYKSSWRARLLRVRRRVANQEWSSFLIKDELT